MAEEGRGGFARDGNDGDTATRIPVQGSGRWSVLGRPFRHTDVQTSKSRVAHSTVVHTILSRFSWTRLRVTDDHHNRILHGLKLRAPGRQVGGRALGGVPDCGDRVEAQLGRTIRGLSRRNAGLSEIEARSSRRIGRGRKFVARRTLTTTTRT